MLYLPGQQFFPRYQLLTWPLPELLLDWLFCRRGLGIYVLPRDEDLAKRILKERLYIKEKKLDKDGRRVHLTAHYRVKQRTVILPYKQFWRFDADSVFLHEIGHAYDYLWSRRRRLLSAVPKMAAALDSIPPLSEYCEIKDKQNSNRVEQFATAFSLYFQEPEPFRDQSIDVLGPQLTTALRKYIILPFEKKDGEQKNRNLGNHRR